MQRLIITIFWVLAMASPAMAEVSDKIPTIDRLWCEDIVLGLLFLFLTRWRWWLGLALLPVTIALIAGSLDMIKGNDLQTAILNEQGNLYIVTVWAASLLLAALHAIGFWLSVRRLKIEGRTRPTNGCS